LNFAAPTTWWGDSGEYSTMPYLSGVLHQPGYNVYLFVGKIFSLIPIGDYGFRANMMSVFFGAAVSSLLFLLLYELTKDRFSSILAALFFCLSFTFWSQSVIADVHTFNMFLIIILLFLIFQWDKKRDAKSLYLFTIVWSISLSAHITNILFAPAFVYFIATGNFKMLKKKLPKLVVLFIIGLLPFLWTMVAANSFSPPPMTKYYFGSTIFPNTPENFFKYVTMSEIDPLNPGFGFDGLVARWFSYAKILQGNFIIIGVIFGIIGIWELLKENRRKVILLILMYLGNLLYFLNHPASEMFSLYLPSFLIFSIWITFGIKSIVRQIKFPKYAATKIIIVIVVGIILFAAPFYGSGFPSIGIATLNYRGDNQTAVFAEKVFTAAEKDSVIITSWEEYAVLFYYQKVYGQRTDLNIYDLEKETEIIDFLQKYDWPEKVYFTSQELSEIGLENINSKYELKQTLRLDFPSTNNFRILYEVVKK
jgi:hypothetical protein